jgi:FtsP/CotA-like multicopper oxidase with cupredoxin domain
VLAHPLYPEVRVPSWTAVRIQQGRGVALLGFTVALACALLLLLSHTSVHATSGGDPYTTPSVVDTNPDPNIVETTIVAAETPVDIGNGITANAETFNGTIPGPTFHLKVGDQVIVHFENHMATKTAIHWHGVELSNGMDGTPFVANAVEPGSTFLYKFTVTRPGMFWYHPHHHSSTNQVFKGLYGLIVVTDPNEAALQSSGALPPASQTKQIVLSDTTVCKAPGQNPDKTYPDTAPHISGASPFPTQLGPTPKSLCETSPIDENGDPKGTPYQQGDIPPIQTKNPNGRTVEGQTVLTNGKNVGARAGDQNAPGALDPGASTLDVQAGQGLRLQILNAATTRYMRLHLSTAAGNFVHMFRVGGEGGLLNNAVEEGGVIGAFDTLYDKGEILIPPGSRSDVIAPIPAGTTGVLTLWTEDYKRVGNGTLYANTATVPVMHLNVAGNAPQTYTIADGTPMRAATGNTVEQLGNANNNLLDPATFADPAFKKGSKLENIQFTAQANNHAGVDGTFGTHDIDEYLNPAKAQHLASTRYAEEGSVLELTLENTTGAHHPFHLHGFAIQPLSLTKSGGPDYTWPYPEFRDNVDVPPHYTLHFRVRLDPRPMPDGVTPGGALGRWLFHCHIFFHATDGMLSELVVVPKSGNERPNINPDVATSGPKQGETALMSGKVGDPDGDPVTLTASIGTVENFGNGLWSWHFDTGQAKSQLVYITATDSNGLKGQAVFDMQISNTPPTLTVPGPHVVNAGSFASFNVSATDPDAVDTLSFAASGLPAGLSLVDNGNRTATISGQPIAPPGVYNATVAVSDGHNPPVTAPLTITIAKAKKPLTAIVDRPERVVNRAVTIGCLLDSPALRSCRVDVLIGKKRVGRGSKTLKSSGKRFTNVRIVLNKATRKKIAKSVPGVKVKLKLLGRRFGSSKKPTATGAAKVVAPKVVTALKSGGFQGTTVTLSSKGMKFLKGTAKQVGRANQVSCAAAAPSQPLSVQRGNAACALLATSGLKAKYSTAAKVGSSPSIAVTIRR